MRDKMTIKEALEAGYTHCGYAGVEYQSLMLIEHVDEDNFEFGGEILIAEKEGLKPIASAEKIREMIADQMESDWGNDTQDDTEEVYNTIIKMDFSDVADRINKALESKQSFLLTNIELVL